MAIRALSSTYSNTPSLPSSYYSASGNLSASGQTSIVAPAMQLDVGGVSLQKISTTTIDVTDANNWDDSDYATAANRAGKDFYLYACQPSTGIEPVFLLSANSTYPSGYTGSDSRKIGGFHGLCASVGTISGHTLTGYLTGSILPQSVWCLKHRAKAVSNTGLVYIPPLKKWAAIYLTSGIVSAPTILFGGIIPATILDNITWFQACDAARLLKMTLPTDYEFGVLAAGSNEGTNILGSADPVTVTAAVDTAGRRMISNFGIEMPCGGMWQLLKSTVFDFAGATAHTHTYASISGDAGTYTSGNASADISPAWSWKDITNSKGQLYTQGATGISAIMAGGTYNSGAYSGSLSRYNSNALNNAGATISVRFVVDGIEK